MTRIEVDERTGRATGVHYVHRGVPRFQRARMVAIAGYSIETPAAAAELGLAPVPRRPVQRLRPGRPLPHGAGRAADGGPVRRRDPDVQGTAAGGEHRGSSTRPTRASPTGAGSPSRRVSPLPITWAEHVTAQGHWGGALRQYMSDYVHWATLGALCEFLPQPDNRVTLADEKDRHGMPVARFSYSQCDNDRLLVQAATTVMEDILTAAGADEVITINRYAHLVGGARMAADEQSGVVDAAAAPSPYPTSTSPTAACCRPRAAPTRP